MRSLIRSLLISLIFVHSLLAAPTTQRTVRVAVIGGMNDSGFWDGITHRFEQTTGIHVEPAILGNKDAIADEFRKGGCDLIVMQNNDNLVNLVADGYAMNAVPWLKVDFVIVGPSDDPAGVKGMTDAAEAIRKIANAKSPFVSHGTWGADEVLRNILEANNIQFDADHMTALIDDHQRRVFQFAVDKNAYTLICRGPFKSGKLQRGKLELMVEHDPRLRRPLMVAIANPAKIAGAHVNEAMQFESFLRWNVTQAWIGEFGKGKYDDQPVFYPVSTDAVATATTQPTQTMLSVTGEVPTPLFLDSDAWAKLPRHQVSAKQKDGSTAQYDGVLIGDVLKSAGISVSNHQMNRQNGSLVVRAQGSDGYVAAFSMAELDDDIAQRDILIADQRDGKPLSETEGPLRIICPQDGIAVRSVRQVVSLTIIRVN